MAVGALRSERDRIRGRDLARLRYEPAEVLHGVGAGRDVVALRLGPRRLFLVNNPELVRRVLAEDVDAFRRGGSSQAYRLGGQSLVGQEGAAHDRHRRLVAPGFGHATVEEYAATITASAQRVDATWADGGVRDVDADMTNHMLDVIGTILFGSEYSEQTATIRDAFDASRKVIHRELLPLSVVLWTLPLPATRRYRETRATLRRALNAMSARRRETGDASDLFGRFATAVDDSGRGLTEIEVADEAWGDLAQGAPAHALTWCWWLLAAHPSLEQRLLDELRERLDGRPPGAGDATALPFTRAFVLEALRLYPPVWGIDRVALREYPLGDLRVPRGGTVFISSYVTQRDARYWPRPLSFEPDRWLGPDARSFDDAAFLVFGTGQRRCIARHLVVSHCVLTLATLAQRWEARPLSSELRIESFPFLRPRGGLRMRLSRRG